MAILRFVSFITFLSLQLLFLDATAQNKRLYKGNYHAGKNGPGISLKNIKKREAITLYGNIGSATYYGDLCDGLDCFTFRPQIGVGISLRTDYFGKRLYLRGEARLFRLYSDDSYQNRNLDFRSTNWEFLVIGEFDLFPYEKMMRRRPLVNPYAFLGIGVMTYDPWGKFPDGNNKWHQLRPLETEHVKYGSMALAVPIGVGFKIRYSYKWNFMVEGGYRFTSTDYIDDVSSHDYAPSNSFSNTISRVMSNKSPLGEEQIQNGQRGNSKSRDGYFILAAGVTYTFSNNHKAKFRGKQHLLRKS